MRKEEKNFRTELFDCARSVFQRLGAPTRSSSKYVLPLYRFGSDEHQGGFPRSGDFFTAPGFARVGQGAIKSGGQALQPSLTVGLLTGPAPVSSPRVSKGSGSLRAARHF